MARQKKDDKPEESGPATGSPAISVEEFRKTRDQVIQGLTGLQLAVGNLLSAYMSHCNDLLGGDEPKNLNTENFQNLAAPFATGIASVAEALLPGENKKEKRKRQKKERDPDMPKRPLTAAFLFGQTARPLVKADLERALAPGEKLGANAVNEEVTRRWNNMDDTDKQLWKNAYQENMVKYKQHMEAYAAQKGTTLAAIAADTDAADAIGGAVGTIIIASEAEPAAPQPVPASASKSAKRRKVTKESGVVGSVAATQSPIPVPKAAGATPAKAAAGRKKAADKAASPEEPKKRRAPRKSKGVDESEAVEATPDATEKKAPNKRKRKADAA